MPQLPADLTFLVSKDSDGRTQLHLASGLRDAQAVNELLLQGADPCVLDSRVGASPLHHAAQHGSVEVAKLLLQHGAFLNLQAPTHGVTPLMTAVWHRKPRLVAFFLNQPDINVNIKSTFGLIARELIGFGASRDDAFAQQQNQELIGLFDTYEKQLQTRLEQQPIFTTLLDKNSSKSDKAKKVRALLAQHASVDTLSPITGSGSDGHTPLLVAARDGLADVAAMLLEAGAEQTLTDHYMQAVPAHKAAYMGHAEVLWVLAKSPKFAEILNARGPYNGYTPLHDATWHGHTEAVRVFLEAGARTDLVGYDGKTALDLAKEYRYDAIVKLIEAKQL
jgi:uncharacterized protein